MNDLFDFQFNDALGFLDLNGTPIKEKTYLKEGSYENDVYKFNLSQTSDLRINLDVGHENPNSFEIVFSDFIEDDADLELYRDSNSNGELDSSDVLVEWSDEKGDDSIYVPGALADTYFTRVEYYDGLGDKRIDYELELSAQLVIEEDPIVSNVTNEISISQLPTGQLIEEGNVGISSNGSVINKTTDRYRFGIEQFGDLNIRLNILTAFGDNANLELFRDSNDDGQLDSNDERLAISENVGNDSINFQVSSPGTYYSLVSPINGDSIQYQLIFDYQPWLPFLRNYNLGSLPIDRTTIGRNDVLEEERFENDVYKFELSETRDLNISLNVMGLDDDADIALIRDMNNNGELDIDDQSGLIITSDSVGDDFITNQTLSSGTYFANITYIDGGGDNRLDYDLDISGQSSSDFIPIYRFQNSSIPGTYLFVGEQERQNIIQNFPNFVEEGQAFKVADEPGNNLIPLNRFQSIVNPGTYLYAGEEESQGIRQNFAHQFREEGIAFYVYDSDSGLGTNFYRFQNSSRPGTYLYAGPEERSGILDNFPNFIEEGEAFGVEI